MERPSHSVLKRFNARWQIVMVLLFNTVVGVVLNFAAGDRYGEDALWQHVFYSQLVGFSILTCIHLAALTTGRTACPRPRELVAGLLAGALLGNVLGSLLVLDPPLGQGLTEFGANLFIALAFGAFASYFFYSIIHIAQGQLDLKRQEMRGLAAEHRLAEHRLRLLQAQIEPHFLFNTLSNIHSLIETHPTRAASMLESLTCFLRASLKRTRDGETTLGDELMLVRAYLEIQRERMGERLGYDIDVPEELLALPLPPLLIQPLVENAVQHGLDPMLEGGAVALRIRRDGGMLRIEVNDTGRGLGGNKGGNGLGIDNVRERLHGLFGPMARIEVSNARPHGTSASMSLPINAPVAGTGAAV